VRRRSCLLMVEAGWRETSRTRTDC
jgi:hypothetical protein